MRVLLDKTGRRLDGGHRPSGQTIVRPKFWEFRWKSFLFEHRVRMVLPCRSDGRTFAASNFHIEALLVRTRRMVVQTANLMHAISYLMLARSDNDDWRLDVWIWIVILALWMSTSGRESTSSGRLQRSSHICVLERNPEAWSNTESRPDGCKLEQFEASRHRGRFRRESTSSGRMML